MDPLRYLESMLQFVKRLQLRKHRAAYRTLDLKAGKSGAEPLPIERSDIHSILVFKPDDIGDAVQSLPALKVLRTQFPRAHLAILCQETTEPIFSALGFLDEIVSMPLRMKWLRFPRYSLSEALSKLSRPQYDVALFLRTYPLYFAQFKKLPARRLLHPQDPRLRSSSDLQPIIRRGRAQASQMLELVSALAGQSAPDAWDYPKLHFSGGSVANKIFGTNSPAPFVVIHPFSRAETRFYPLEHWNAILKWIQQKITPNVVVVGSAADPDLAFSVPVISAKGKLSLAETAELLAGAHAFLGTLSGPAHLAAARGIPTVTFAGGHSDLEEWGPRGSRSLVLGGKPACSPCYRHFCSVGLICLTEMTPERVIPRIEEFLAPKSELGQRGSVLSTMRPLAIEILPQNAPG